MVKTLTALAIGSVLLVGCGADRDNDDSTVRTDESPAAEPAAPLPEDTTSPADTTGMTPSDGMTPADEPAPATSDTLPTTEEPPPSEPPPPNG
jgi:hypothetical protein